MAETALLASNVPKLFLSKKAVKQLASFYRRNIRAMSHLKDNRITSVLARRKN